MGADNGIAIAYALALAEDASLAHPPMELLFTVDEETGLNGVKAMAADLVEGKRLINLDSEDEGIFTIGCAGGVDTRIAFRFDPAPPGKDCESFRISVGGLNRRHSGIDIHKQRANANRLLGRILARLGGRMALRLSSFAGGTRHNAIARDATAMVACEASQKG